MSIEKLRLNNRTPLKRASRIDENAQTTSGLQQQNLMSKQQASKTLQQHQYEPSRALSESELRYILIRYIIKC